MKPRAKCTALHCNATKNLRPVKFPHGEALYCPEHFLIWDSERFAAGLVIRIINDDEKLNQSADGTTQPKLF